MTDETQAAADQETVDETVNEEAKEAQPAEPAQEKDSENFPDKTEE